MPGTQLAKYNKQLQDNLAAGRTVAVVQACIMMKRLGITPDVTTYNCLIRAMANDLYYYEAWAVYRDMEALGISPNIETYNALLYVSAYRRGVYHGL